MIANFFRKTKPIHALFIGVLFFCYYLAAQFFIEKPSISVIYVFKTLGILFLFLILFFLIRFINRKNQLSSLNSYVLLFIAILFGIFPKTMLLNDVFISHFILLFAFRRIYSLKTNKDIKEKLFDSGLFIGLATLIYSWSAIFLILVFVAVFIRKIQNFRSLLIPVLGFLTPVFLTFTYYLLQGDVVIFYEKLTLNYSFLFEVFRQSNYIIPLSILGLIIATAIVVVSLKLNAITNDLRPSWFLIMTHLFLGLYVLLFSVNIDGSQLVFIFSPTAIIMTNFLQLLNKMILRDIVLFIFLGLSVFSYL